MLLIAGLSVATQQTMVAPALPAVEARFGASTTTVSFLITGFLLTASVATPIFGRLGDMFGKERMLVLVLTAFACGSLVCALADSIEVLIAGRALQGLAGAVFPLAFGIIRDELPARRVAMGIGLMGATFGVGGAAGVVISGVLVDQLGYQWLFWVALPVIVAAIAATMLWIPESPVRSPGRIDLGGALLLSAALVSLLVAVSEVGTLGLGPVTTGLLALGVLLLLAWVVYERGHPEPLVDMDLMSVPAVRTTNIAAFLVGFGMFGGLILIPKLVQLPASTGFGFGARATEASLYLIPSSLTMLFAAPLAGWLGGRVGSRSPLLIGTAAGAAAFALLSVLQDRWSVYAASALMGIGIGASLAAMSNLIVEAVPPSSTGVASGVNKVMRTIGGSIGGQVAASLVAVSAIGGDVPERWGFTAAFGAAGVGMVLAFGTALTLPVQMLQPATDS